MKYKYVFLVIILLMFGTSASAEYFKHIGLSEGLTQPSVMAIYQDRLGRMWFGTREGINMYDGKQVTSFKGWFSPVGKDAPVWLGNEVSAIAGDSLGDIFFLIDGGIIRYDMRTERFESLSGLNKVSVLTSFEGDIWYMRHDSLFCRRAEKGESVFMLKTNIKARISCLALLPDKICIGTLDGVFFIDRASREQTRALEGKEVYRIFESSEKELWLGTRMHGLYRMKRGESAVSVPYKPGSPDGISSWQIRDFAEDDERNIWFGTFDGLQKYNSDTREYSLVQIPQYASGLTHPSIFSLYKDIQGTIWVGSYFGGVNYFIPRHESFMHYDYDKNATKNLYYSYIGDLLTDRDGRLWLSTDGGGIICVDKNWNILYRLTAGDGNSLPHNNIKSIAYDFHGDCVYIGTYLGGLSRYDIQTGRFRNYLEMSYGDNELVPNEVVFHVKMWRGQLYLSARNGVFRLDTRTQRFHKLDIPSSYYECFDIDNEGYMYLAEKTSVLCVDLNKGGAICTLPIPTDGHGAQVTRIRATDTGIYVSTLGAGVFYYDKSAKQTIAYTARKHQLPSDFCYNICTTRNGNVLITTDQGVTCFSPRERSFTTINLKDNFSSSHIINGCGVFVSDSGKIFIGDTKGVTVLSEKDFNKEEVYSNAPDLYFSQLWVNNRLVTPGDGSGILSDAFPYTDRLTLNYRQNNLIFGFALSDYKQLLSKRRYQYKLDGFDSDWIRTNQSEAHYTNLAPGDYTFRVATLINKGYGKFVAGKEITVRIVIASPWYNTWWAWGLYIGIFCGCIYYFISSRVEKRTLALSLEKERFEKLHIEKLNHEKLVFFTNVSHEFRTPLTLIISHIDILLQRYSLTPLVYNQILKIRKNAQKMNNLISELLEFRKLEQNYEILQLSQQDIRVFLKEIYLSFVDYARQREINYVFDFSDTPVLCWFDAQLMEKVFFNLLSNAFKYTSNGGTVSLSGEIDDQKIVLHITDTGIGIAEQETGKIFTRFYQSSDPEKKSSFFSGTGIGLALTKTIVEKHHGIITVNSVVGEGTTFTVELPRRKEEFADDKNVRLTGERPEEMILPDSLPVSEDDDFQSEETIQVDNITDRSRTLLLVEDNKELMQVLVELFTPFYQVVSACNGKEGLRRVYECKPDLIVSDVMMPEMTGTEMCLQIKNNLDFCHIPVVLLTALNSPEQNMEGFNRGADDYITKPFHARLLLTRVNNLLRNRLLIQHQFDKQPMSEIDLTSINPLDKDLLKRVSQVIERHIDDLEFDIPVLCKEVGIGRSLLYAKFKALTGMTPNNYILNYRLKYAATLLRQYADIPIAEVSDRCGFNSPMYFSRCFKNQYGCAPQEYKKGKKSVKSSAKD